MIRDYGLGKYIYFSFERLNLKIRHIESTFTATKKWGPVKILAILFLNRETDRLDQVDPPWNASRALIVNMATAPWDRARSHEQLFVLITGANR